MPHISISKTTANDAIDANSSDLIAISQDVWNHPESGFREHRTAKLVAEFMKKIGLEPRDNVAITGVIARIDTGRPGPHVAIFGELTRSSFQNTGLLISGRELLTFVGTIYKLETCSLRP